MPPKQKKPKYLNLSEYPEIMSLDEFAEFIRLSRKTILNKRSAGESLPPTLNFSRTLLFKRDDVAAWVKSNVL